MYEIGQTVLNGIRKLRNRCNFKLLANTNKVVDVALWLLKRCDVFPMLSDKDGCFVLTNKAVFYDRCDIHISDDSKYLPIRKTLDFEQLVKQQFFDTVREHIPKSLSDDDDGDALMRALCRPLSFRNNVCAKLRFTIKTHNLTSMVNYL